MTVFTKQRINRARNIRKLPTASPFAVLCTEASQEWEAARKQLDIWISKFPPGAKKAELERNVANFGDQHIGAFFELAAFHLFGELQLPIIENKSSLDYPDFFLAPTDAPQIYTEVTSLRDDTLDEQLENMIKDLLLRIEKSLKTTCHLLINIKTLTAVQGQDFLKKQASSISELVERGLSAPDDFRSIYDIRSTDGAFHAEVIWTGYSSGESSVGWMGPLIGGDKNEIQENVSERVKRKIKRHLEVSPDSQLLVVLSSEKHGAGVFHDDSFHVGYGPEIFQLTKLDSGELINPRIAINTHLGIFTPSIREGSLIPPSNRCCIGILDIKRIGIGIEGFRFHVSYTPNIFARDPELLLSPRIPKTISKYEFSFEDGKIQMKRPEKQTYYETTCHGLSH